MSALIQVNDGLAGPHKPFVVTRDGMLFAISIAWCFVLLAPLIFVVLTPRRREVIEKVMIVSSLLRLSRSLRIELSRASANELSAGCWSAMTRFGQPQAKRQGTHRVRTDYPPNTIWRSQIRSFRIDLFCDGILTETAIRLHKRC